MKKHNIAFLFGAGAEGKDNFDIRMGYDYLAASLYPDEDKNRKCYAEELKNFFNKSYYNDSFTNQLYTVEAINFMLCNFVTQKSLHNKDYFYTHINDIQKILSKEQLKELKELYGVNIEHISTDSGYITELRNELKDVLTKNKKYLCEIEYDVIKELFEEIDGNLIIDINVGIGGVLDSYFHTIINPNKFGKGRFSKIFNFYWACYFTILEDVLKFLSKKEFDKYLENGEKINYSEVLKNIDDLTKQLYKIDISKALPPDSYYALIKKKLNCYEKKLNCCGVITTNYFKFCEAVSSNVVYLNGQLKYFEYPEILEVTDLTADNVKNEYLMFPFIFSQSLVKPIVNFRQIEEFYKLSKVLSDADLLVVLGFNINEDDNHINAYLHDFAKSKPIIVITDDEDCTAKNKLKHNGKNIHICHVKYGNNETVIDKMFTSIQEVLSESEENQK